MCVTGCHSEASISRDVLVQTLPLKGEIQYSTISMSRFSLAVRRQAGKQRDVGSSLLRLSFFFKSCGLWTLPGDFVPPS